MFPPGHAVLLVGHESGRIHCLDCEGVLLMQQVLPLSRPLLKEAAVGYLRVVIRPICAGSLPRPCLRLTPPEPNTPRMGTVRNSLFLFIFCSVQLLFFVCLASGYTYWKVHLLAINITTLSTAVGGSPLQSRAVGTWISWCGFLGYVQHSTLGASPCKLRGVLEIMCFSDNGSQTPYPHVLFERQSFTKQFVCVCFRLLLVSMEPEW